MAERAAERAVEVRREYTHNNQPKLAAGDREYSFSIIGLITSICGQPVVGLILSIIALKQSREAGRHNIYALLGLIFSIVNLAWIILILGFYVVVFGISLFNGVYGGRF